MAKETKKEKQKINIDGTEYDSDQLSDKAKNIIGFVQKIDKEATELRFQLDKVTLARKQAVIDLQEEIKQQYFVFKLTILFVCSPIFIV